MHVGGATGLLLGATSGLEPLLAGMPTPQLTDWGSLRLQSISFFAMGFLLSSLVVWTIWNSLRRDFPRLPQLSFGKASGLVLLWGLLFIVVLTMISGARELMTPGAWDKQGATYKLKTDYANQAELTLAKPEQLSDELLERKARLERLKQALWKYAAEHERQFPSNEQAAGVPDSLWVVDEPTGTRYVYAPGAGKPEPQRPLVYEPQIIDARPWVLLSNGAIEQRDFDSVVRQLAAEASP